MYDYYYIFQIFWQIHLYNQSTVAILEKANTSVSLEKIDPSVKIHTYKNEVKPPQVHKLPFDMKLELSYFDTSYMNDPSNVNVKHAGWVTYILRENSLHSIRQKCIYNYKITFVKLTSYFQKIVRVLSACLKLFLKPIENSRTLLRSTHNQNYNNFFQILKIGDQLRRSYKIFVILLLKLYTWFIWI